MEPRDSGELPRPNSKVKGQIVSLIQDYGAFVEDGTGR